MRKLLIAIGVIALALAGVFFSTRTVFRQSADILESGQTIPTVIVDIRNNGTISTYSGIRAATAYDALLEVSRQTGTPVSTKQYDFGMFIERIGDKSSTGDTAWLYFINDTSATAAADRQALQDGDVVSWRYMEPSL